MKEIAKQLQFTLQDTDIENINFTPQILLFNKEIYQSVDSHSSGTLTLSRFYDTTSAYIITYSTNLVYIESTDLIHISINNEPPIETRAYSYDNPNIPISITISLPNTNISTYNTISEYVKVSYMIASYDRVIV